MSDKEKPQSEDAGTAKVNLALVPEFSHIVEVDKLPSLGRMFKLKASDTELEKLATRLGLASFKEFKIEMKLVPMGRSSIVKLEGKISATLAQPCVVSLAPVAEVVDEVFELQFAPETDDDRIDDREFVLSEGDPYEPLEDGKIDVAEVATQHLSLSLNPYPRSEKANLENLQQEAEKAGRNFEVNGGKVSPFAALSKLNLEKK